LQLCYPQQALNMFLSCRYHHWLAEGHQLAHARKLGMTKNFQSFPFRWHKPDTCTTISFRDIHFLFWIPFIWTFCSFDLGINKWWNWK
jgi:hypothetical protein